MYNKATREHSFRFVETKERKLDLLKMNTIFHFRPVDEASSERSACERRIVNDLAIIRGPRYHLRIAYRLIGRIAGTGSITISIAIYSQRRRRR